jgi:sugar phosphate isomerase/epimerase
MLPVLLTDSVTPALDRAVNYALLWGLEGVVLRTVGGPSDRVPFVNETRMRRLLDENEMPVAAIDPGLFEGPAAGRGAWMNDIASLAEIATFCRRIGCARVITGAFAGEPDVDSASEALRRGGGEAGRRGIRLAVRNDAGSAFQTGAALAELLAATDDEHVGACWSPADALEAGEEDLEGGLAALDGRVEMVIVRDGRLDRGVWRETLPGEGSVDWECQLALLRESGFDGPLCMEVRGEPKAKVGLRAATAMLGLMRQRRS